MPDEPEYSSEDPQEMYLELLEKQRAVINSALLDPSVAQMPEKGVIVAKLFEALEAVAWLYNCRKLQI